MSAVDPVNTYTTVDGDVLDAILYTRYGVGPDAMTPVLRANPHMRDLPSVLPAGITITFPELPVTVTSTKVILWD